MLTDKIGIKLFADASRFPKGSTFIEVFHDWIRTKVLPELMIDVVDYAHVERGTHVYFCGHESDYIIDTADGRPGLLYRRKRAPLPANGTPFDDSLTRLLAAAERLEKEPRLEGLSFSRSELWIGAFDRLRAPNDEASFSALASVVLPLLEKRFGKKARVLRGSVDPHELLSATATIGA